MLLKELTELNGISGNEDAVREYIKNKVSEMNLECKTDSIGNVIVHKKGSSSDYKIMLSAHMDEIGFIVTGYGENGTLKFKTVGGIDERILPGKRVVIGNSKIPGVIGCKPIHMQEREERGINIKLKSLYIDIGAEKKEEAEKLAPLGDYISFHSEYVEFGEECVKAKALDDRVGCAVLIEMLKGQYEFDLYACFTVQEEVGLRGSEVAAYNVNPDIALIIEGTTCSDVPEVDKQDYSTLLGEGAALTIMDRTSYADKNLVRLIYDLSKKYGIKVQFKQTTTGGNDAGKIQRSRSGVKVASISVPCRYIHSPVSVMSKRDYESCKEIVSLALREMSRNTDYIQTIKNGGTVDV
ncbi:MAG: M42 family metallopeptidase [Clostridia bacterium]|nr:M42 family metallopeptidase [Clostridia bacterium]